MKIYFFVLVMGILSFSGCSSTKDKGKSNGEKTEENLPERKFLVPYILLDAQEKQVPSWVNDPEKWGKENEGSDYNHHRYFFYQSGPKKRQNIACELAKAKAAATIAGEITQFIKRSLAESIMGDASDNDDNLQEYVETNLAQEIQSFVVGARVHRTYWEQRHYKEELGADKEFNGFICSALVKIEKKNLLKAIRLAQKKLEGVVNAEAKDKVQEALKKVEEKFETNLNAPTKESET